MDSLHSEGLLAATNGELRFTGHDVSIASFNSKSHDAEHAQAFFHRLAACWNAFEGIPTDRFDGKSVAEYACAESYLTGLNPAAGGGMEMGLEGLGVQLLAATMAGQFKANGAVNFLEVNMFHPDTGPLLVTMQRQEGETPAQQRNAARRERDEALSENALLKQQLARATAGSAALEKGLPDFGSFMLAYKLAEEYLIDPVGVAKRCDNELDRSGGLLGIVRMIARFKRTPMATTATADCSDQTGTAHMSDAMQDVISERRRQMTQEGWTLEHDDEHDDECLARAAACYAMPPALLKLIQRTEAVDLSNGFADTPLWHDKTFNVPEAWPENWSATWWKPKDRRQDLVRAGALVISEIERIDRASENHSISTSNRDSA